MHPSNERSSSERADGINATTDDDCSCPRVGLRCCRDTPWKLLRYKDPQTVAHGKAAPITSKDKIYNCVYRSRKHHNIPCCERGRSSYEDITRMRLPLQLAAEMTCTCFPSLCMYLLLAQIDNNNNNAHFGYVHHLNNIPCERQGTDWKRQRSAKGQYPNNVSSVKLDIPPHRREQPVL